jgi:membrane associated rhomboid family serine protease
MFYAIPLENRPTWRNPPWMTVLLIIVNMVIFWGPQRTEDVAQEKATAYYVASMLPALEVPEFVAWLQETSHPKASQAQAVAKEPKAYSAMLEFMEAQPGFLQQLKADKRITPSHPSYAEWKKTRQAYEAQQPPKFTYLWSQNFMADQPLRYETLVSSAFLHASTGHLLGNMLFLFLFGFSVELLLGRFWYLLFYLAGAVGGALLAQWVYAGNGNYGLGASGAVSALMGMYAVMYRLKRIRFFYQLFFYFNYIKAPALILLPIWAINEAAQHFWGQQNVSYMAHLGGLVTGAALMALALYAFKIQSPVTASEAAPDPFKEHVQKARKYSEAMQFDRAVVEWRSAAKLRPTDTDVLRAWFGVAKLQPASDDFHRAAKAIFKLTAADDATLQWQHTVYRIYLDEAKPGARLNPDTMAHLARRFTRAGQWGDADKLCRALLKTSPEHPGLGNTLCVLANGLVQSGQRDTAKQWLPHLQRLAPTDAVTRNLQAA